MKLLYICEANLFRSPIAAILTRKKTKGTNLRVDSAGLREENQKASSYLFIALRRLGYSTHRPIPKKITFELLMRQDLILCMEKWHVNKILSCAPRMKNTIFTLPQYVGFPNEEIVDPPKLVQVYFNDPTDVSAEEAIEFWINIIEGIEKYYVDLAIQRMKRDGLIV